MDPNRVEVGPFGPKLCQNVDPRLRNLKKHKKHTIIQIPMPPKRLICWELMPTMAAESCIACGACCLSACLAKKLDVALLKPFQMALYAVRFIVVVVSSNDKLLTDGIGDALLFAGCSVCAKDAHQSAHCWSGQGLVQAALCKHLPTRTQTIRRRHCIVI